MNITSDEIAFIVERLNEVLRLDLTLVGLDEKSGQDLLQILNDVLSTLDSSQNVELRDEGAEMTASRILDFVGRILNMKQLLMEMPGDVAINLVAGDRNVIYPLLFWILKNYEQHKKRVYLARYLVQIEVPDEYLTDENVAEAFNTYKQRIEDFKAAHKHVTALREASANPGELKQEIANMEADKEKLAAKIAAAKKKFSDMNQNEKYLAAISALRKEQETEKLLQQRMMEQEQQLTQAENRLRAAMANWKDQKKEFGSTGGLHGLIRNMESEVNFNRKLVTETLPRQLKEQKDLLERMQRVAYEPIDLEELEADLRRLHTEVNALLEKQSEANKPKDDKLTLFRQQTALVAKRKEELEEKVNELLMERQRLEEERMRKEEEAESLRSSKKILRGEDFKKYAASLRGKSNTYKRMKAEMALLRSEMGILLRTEEILKSRDENLQEYLDEVEANRGVSGFRRMQEDMEEISKLKSKVDEQKGQTLEEISRVVNEFNNTINEKKKKLGPLMKLIKETRQAATDLEQEYYDKKAVYEHTALGLDSEQAKLMQEVSNLQDECEQSESLYHLYNCKILIAETAAKRLTDELEFKMGKRRLNDKYKTYQEMFEAKVAELTALSKELSEKQRIIKENHEPNLKQIAWFTNLRKLLECKLQLYKQLETAGEDADERFGPMDLADMASSSINRLVIS